MPESTDCGTRVQEAVERDPRSAPYGYFTGSSSGLDITRVFQWFHSIEDLIDHLKEVEPRIYDLDEEELAKYLKQVTPILERLKVEGFTDMLLSEFNQAAKEFAIVEWWGQFDEILEARCPLGKDLVESFLDDEGSSSDVKPDQLDEFVEYLQTCGV